MFTPEGILVFIIVLGVLIFVHELGHFAVAKYFDVKVEKFSLGFGPAIFSVKRGETEYMLSAIPLGGYVKMFGESREDEKGKEWSAWELERAFDRKPIYQRVLIVAAGPVMNFILAVVVFPLPYMLGTSMPAFLYDEARLEYVDKGGQADKGGMKAGDVIIEADGEKIENWSALNKVILLSPGKELTFTVKRGTETFKAPYTPGKSAKEGMGTADDILPSSPPVVGALASGMPADVAGLKKGDRITAIDGVEISYWYQISREMAKKQGERVVTYVRDGKTMDVKLTPKFDEEAKRQLIGINPLIETVVKKFGFVESIKLGMAECYEQTYLIFKFIKGLFTGLYSVKALGGPIMIAQVTGSATSAGFTKVLVLVAIISLNLAVLNLFPIPVLDGGVVVMLIAEKLKGAPLSDKMVGVFQQIGLAMIIALIALVMWNDIWRMFN